MRWKTLRNRLLAAALLLPLSWAHAAGNPCNPCAAKPQNPCSPGAAAKRIDPGLVTRPAGTRLASGKQADLIREGEKLWHSKAIGTNGMSCATCHQDNSGFSTGFAKPYPHRVAMVEERSGLKQVALDEMVQFCMVAPMAARPLPWDSRELAALTAYAAQVQKQFKPAAAAPGAAKNPCGARNPCAPGNPCAPRK